jgi:hypothetical protein
LTYTVVTYDTSGEVMTVYTTPDGYAGNPRQLVKNALDLEGSAVAKVWEGDDITDRPPLHAVRWEQ